MARGIRRGVKDRAVGSVGLFLIALIGWRPVGDNWAE